MVPKIIHYSWFSNDPIPDHIQQFMATWKKIMPEYEYVLWDGSKLAKINNTFANEAISVKKWAFAADFLRLHAIYYYGGIWFDTDIEVFKSFNPFLNDRMFIAHEAGAKGYNRKFHWLTGHCFGAEKNHPFIKDCLDFYTERHFIRTQSKAFSQDFQYDMTTIPEVMATVALKYGYNDNGFYDNEQQLKEGIHVYPSYFFDKPMYNSMKKVYSIHREAGGWRPGNEGKAPNFAGTTPRKGRLINKLKVTVQKLLLRVHISIVRVR